MIQEQNTAPLNQVRTAEILSQFTPLDQEQRTAVTTAEAAYHLNRKAQTLLIWSCKEIGPIRPIKVCGRLMWRTDDLRKLVGADRLTIQVQ
jgi:hypothetical protein